MKRLRVVGILILVLATVPAFADKASSAYKKGADAEARNKVDEAYQEYKAAHDLRPKDPKYTAAFLRLRFYAATNHVHDGQLLREAGKLQEALAEFQRAAQIDPTSFIAVQEIQRTQQMIEKGAPQAARVIQSPLAQMAEHAEGPVVLKPPSNIPITLRITENTKVIYNTIGKLAGINVLFDPDYNPRKVSIELNGVTLNEALGIVAMASKTFWRPVTPNTIFVAADSSAKRKELEQSVIKTFYLGNVSTQTDLQDAVNTIRQILDISRVQQVQSQNAIVVRGTPDQLVLAEKLLQDIDKAKPEVVIDIAVLQTSRDRVRTLGIVPPTTFSASLQNTGTAGTTGTTTGGGGSTFTVNQLANLNANNILITIPGATLTTLMSDSNTKIIQNPQIRALDNQKATLKIGERVPVATGSFQPGIGGVGINPLVNTQFQYIDVGVNIDITPRIHTGREVTLKITMEVSSVTGQENIGGISQPIIGQRRIEHETRLREGEVNLLAGILEDSETQSISGYPWLIKIPILKYLFGQEDKERHQNEIVFAITPHVVRAQDVTELNLRPIDVGTANSIELRKDGGGAAPAPAPTDKTSEKAPAQPQRRVPTQPQPSTPAGPPAESLSAAPSAPRIGQAVQPPVAPPASQMAAVAPPPATSAAAPAAPALAVLAFDPTNTTQEVGSTFVVDVTISGAQNVYSVPLQLNYDPKILQLLNISNGSFLGRDGQPVALVHRDDTTTGTLQMTGTRSPGASGIGGSGPVFSLTFMAKAAGQSYLSISRASALDPAMTPTPLAGGQALITVSEPTSK